MQRKHQKKIDYNQINFNLICNDIEADNADRLRAFLTQNNDIFKNFKVSIVELALQYKLDDENLSEVMEFLFESKVTRQLLIEKILQSNDQIAVNQLLKNGFTHEDYKDFCKVFMLPGLVDLYLSLNKVGMPTELQTLLISSIQSLNEAHQDFILNFFTQYANQLMENLTSKLLHKGITPDNAAHLNVLKNLWHDSQLFMAINTQNQFLHNFQPMVILNIQDVVDNLYRRKAVHPLMELNNLLYHTNILGFFNELKQIYFFENNVRDTLENALLDLEKAIYCFAEQMNKYDINLKQIINYQQNKEMSFSFFNAPINLVYNNLSSHCIVDFHGKITFPVELFNINAINNNLGINIVNEIPQFIKNIVEIYNELGINNKQQAVRIRKMLSQLDFQDICKFKFEDVCMSNGNRTVVVSRIVSYAFTKAFDNFRTILSAGLPEVSQEKYNTCLVNKSNTKF